jgi:hypothetical protein
MHTANEQQHGGHLDQSSAKAAVSHLPPYALVIVRAFRMGKETNGFCTPGVSYASRYAFPLAATLGGPFAALGPDCLVGRLPA